MLMPSFIVRCPPSLNRAAVAKRGDSVPVVPDFEERLLGVLTEFRRGVPCTDCHLGHPDRRVHDAYWSEVGVFERGDVLVCEHLGIARHTGVVMDGSARYVRCFEDGEPLITGDRKST